MKLLKFTICMVIVGLLWCPSVTNVDAKPAFVLDLNIIAEIESNHNPKAYNSRSKARGLYQITPICLREYNETHKSRYIWKDLYDPKINKKIARWYLGVRIPQMLKAHRIPVTIKNVLICYNAGIKYLIQKKSLPRQTRVYLKKYLS